MDGASLTPSAEPDGRSSKKKKLKNLQCSYCSDKFHRLEHLQRHERTHTKEKPFACFCGKAFARRDLLLRHEKLVHDIESDRLPRRSSAAVHTTATTHVTRQSFNGNESGPVNPKSQETASRLQDDWPSQESVGIFESSVHQYGPTDDFGSGVSQAGGFSYGQAEQELPQAQSITISSNMENSAYASNGLSEVPGDYHLFFDNFDLQNFYLPTTVFDSELPISLWSRPNLADDDVGHEAIMDDVNDPQTEQDALSRFGSRLPSLHPEEPSLMTSEPSPHADFLRAGPPWKVTGQDHRTFQTNLKEFESVLPEGFHLPSRHTFSRYFEGYISGFNQHLPFLHIPTFSMDRFVPELVLAIAAVGAQYRFESTRGNKLWYAAKAVADEQIRRRHSKPIADILTSPVPRYASHNTSPTSQSAAINAPDISRSEGHYQVAAELCKDPRSLTAQARLGTIQALLVLMAMGMWGPQALLREAMLIQNQLSLLLRDQGLCKPSISKNELSWEDWILLEGDCRTKCIAYCFFNLHSIAYNTPPHLLTPEMKVDLPESAEIWRAPSAAEWRFARQTSTQSSPSFHSILSKLFAFEQEDLPPISSLGNYVLIHAIIQQIFFVRQGSTLADPTTRASSLQSSDIEKFGQVLSFWQSGWERAPESSLDPTNPYGPVAFSSTALLRLAYIRLHCDLGPSRRLETRDSQIIAHTLKASPPLNRSRLLNRAILQAAHALSIPVKIGISFVAHTQTLTWSMQHSLANLECAFLLSKWLYMIADCVSELTLDERNLLEMVQSIVGETNLAIQDDGEDFILGRKEVKQLSIAVVRLWAEIFTGSHHVFQLVKDIGAALNIYAGFLEIDNEVQDSAGAV